MPCITFAAVIDSGACGENLTWTFDDNGTLTISGTGDMYDYGTWVMGKSAPWYQSRYDIKKVVISNGVTHIGNYAFADCNKFGNDLRSINIPSSVSSIGYSAFLYCGKLNIDVSDDNSYYCDIDGILFSKDKKSIIKYTKYILQPEYSIPSGVTNIGDAFSMCPELKSVIIPQGVLEIADDAFIFSSNLTSITIPDSIKSIDNWGFNWNVSPKDVYYIGTKAQWDKIEFVHGNDWLKNSTIHCINGDISLGTEDNTNNSGTSNGGQTTTGENGTTTITNNTIVTSIELYIGQTTANVNGQAVQNDVAPVVRNDRTMLPARFVAENLGAAVAWDQAAQQVVITPIN